MYIFFFIIQRVKARVIPCPHQPPTRGDNTVSVAQGSTTATYWRYQAAFATGQGIKRIIYIYIYTPDQLRAETSSDVNLHFQSAVW